MQSTPIVEPKTVEQADQSGAVDNPLATTIEESEGVPAMDVEVGAKVPYNYDQGASINDPDHPLLVGQPTVEASSVKAPGEQLKGDVVGSNTELDNKRVENAKKGGGSNPEQTETILQPQSGERAKVLNPEVRQPGSAQATLTQTLRGMAGYKVSASLVTNPSFPQNLQNNSTGDPTNAIVWQATLLLKIWLTVKKMLGGRH